MKKILLSLLLSTIILTAFSQPISNRSSGAVTTQDARWSALYNMLLPKYDDTTQANLPQYIGLDSCGAAIFTRSDNNFWIKQCNPKKWVLVSGGGGSGTVTSVATTNGYAMLSSVSNPTLAANILLAVDSAALSVKYLRRADSTLYVTQKKLNDTAAAIRADIGGGSTTLPEAYANGNRFDSNATMNMAGNSHTIDSAQFYVNAEEAQLKVKNDSIILNSNSHPTVIGDAYRATGGSTLTVNKNLDTTEVKSAAFTVVRNDGQRKFYINTVDDTVAVYTPLYLMNYPDSLINNFSLLGRDRVTNKIGVVSVASGSGTVTSVATGLGLSGGTITSTGTLLLDTASASVISRQRAAATYQPLSTTWLLTGNSGTNSTHFLGTINAANLRFKTNNGNADYSYGGGNNVTDGTNVAMLIDGQFLGNGNMVTINPNSKYVGNNRNVLAINGAGGSIIVSGDCKMNISSNLTVGGALNAGTVEANSYTRFRQLNSTELCRFDYTNLSVLIGGTTNIPSSILTLTSTTKGFLLPRMTTTQRDAISSPATGLITYVTDSTKLSTYDGTRWSLTPKVLINTATLDFGNTSAQNSADLTITVTGAADGDMVSLGVPNASTLTNSDFTAWVSATNTVTVRFNNYSSGSQDPASGTFKVQVFK